MTLMSAIEHLANQPPSSLSGTCMRESFSSTNSLNDSKLLEELAKKDDLLHTLLKDYQNADQTYNKLLKRFKTDDDMVQLAADMYLSSKSALETRVNELKKQDLLEFIQVEEEEAEKEKQRAKRVCDETTMMNRARERMNLDQKSQSEMDILWFMFLTFMRKGNRVGLFTKGVLADGFTKINNRVSQTFGQAATS